MPRAHAACLAKRARRSATDRLLGIPLRLLAAALLTLALSTGARAGDDEQLRDAARLLGIVIDAGACRGRIAEAGCLLDARRDGSPEPLRIFVRRVSAWMQLVVDGSLADQREIAARVERVLGRPSRPMDSAGECGQTRDAEWEVPGAYVLLPCAVAEAPSFIAHVLLGPPGKRLPSAAPVP